MTRASDGDDRDVVVVGNGPLGSAIGRHLADAGASVLVLDGGASLTSASNDMGRIVRPLDAEGREGWTRWNVASIDAFPELEAASGISFFEKSGSLACGTPAFVEKPARLMRDARVPFDELASGDAVAARFPFLRVPSAHVAVRDDVGGFVNPARMIAAQNALMTKHPNDRGVVREGVVTNVAVDDGFGGATATTATGETRRGKFVVLAGGAYTAWLAAASGLTTIAPPPNPGNAASTTASTTASTASPLARSGVGSVRLSRRTVLLAEVTASDAKGVLSDMPTLKYQHAPEQRDVSVSAGESSSHGANEAMSVYVLPPIYYPGPDVAPGWYVKICGGANDFFERERWADTVNDLERWMASDGDDDVADRLHDVLVDLMPTTNFLSLTSKPCVTTCTDDGELQCERLGKNGRVIAVGGCQGKAAGPADAIGRAVASQVMDALREA